MENQQCRTTECKKRENLQLTLSKHCGSSSSTRKNAACNNNDTVKRCITDRHLPFLPLST